jgi:hypothetical protein
MVNKLKGYFNTKILMKFPMKDFFNIFKALVPIKMLQHF